MTWTYHRMLGYLRLKPGDYVLTRDIDGDGAQENDQLQLWVMAK